MNTPQGNRILELDALRGFSALFVVFFHLTMGKEQSHLGFVYGVTGVDLFFIISGFVIFLTLSSIHHWKEFVISRVARLFPTYWFAVSFTFLLLLCYNIYSGLDNSVLIQRYLANLTMLQYYMLIPDLDGPYWTLIIELVFYVAMLFVFLLGKLDRIQWIGTIVLVLIVFDEFVLQQYFPRMNKLIGLACPLINYFPLFFAGILFFKVRNKTSNWFSYLLILGCYLLQLVLFNNAGNSWQFIKVNEYAVVLGIYFFFFVLFVSNNLNWLVNRITLFLGKVSYPLYLVHQTLCIQFLMPFFVDKMQINFWLAAVLSALVAILVATVTVKLIDNNLSKKFKSWMKRKMLKEKNLTKTPV